MSRADPARSHLLILIDILLEFSIEVLDNSMLAGMADFLSVVVSTVQLVSAVTAVVLDVLDISLRESVRAINVFRLYGSSGLILLFFASKTTWRVEAQVLGQLDERGQIDDNVAMDFGKSVQDECTMISTAAAFTAQIAITALSLSSLSQTHWVVRGLSVFSLISALMAVCYATTQHRTLGRLLSAAQVRAWIRGGTSVSEKSRIVPSLSQIFSTYSLLTAFRLVLRNSRYLNSPSTNPLLSSSKHHHLCDVGELQDEDFYSIETNDSTQIKNIVVRKCFAPGITSVVTMSAPQMLLSAHLMALLLALGVYLGFIWTRNLDTDAGLNDSRNVFVMYIVGLVICILVYSVSQLIQNEDARSEQTIVEHYMMDYVHRNPEMLQRLKIQVIEVENDIVFSKIVEVSSIQE